jgi:hypothetical protein
MNRSSRSLAVLALVLTCAAALVACGNDSNQALDAGVDHATPAEDAGQSDTSAQHDTGAPQVDAGQNDVGQSDTTTGGWPPAGPFHSGKACALPACDTNGAVAADLSGTWTQALTTVSSDCNALAISMKPELQTGHVMTKTGLSSPRQGECVYDSTNTSLVVGVIKGDVMITCQVQPVDTGVTPVVESVMTFGSGSATGTAVTYLFDVPLNPANCSANYTVTMTRE